MNSFIGSSCLPSPLTPNHSKSTQKCVRVLSKRRMLLSPSKDLMIFFDSKTFTKFNPINANKDQKSHTKLTLDRKNMDLDKKLTQKNCQCQKKKQHKILSVTNSTESFKSNRESQKEKEQKFAKLKKQVDQIRRKYSYSKLGPKKQLKKVNSSEFLRVSIDISAMNNSNDSSNKSKQKTSILTPKNDPYLGRKILTKNEFFDKPIANLKLKQNMTKTLKLNTLQSEDLRRKESFQFENMTSSINLNSQNSQEENSKIFQFTFGKMALMDFKNKENLREKSKNRKL